MQTEVGALFESMGGEIPLCKVKDYIRSLGLSDDDIENFFETTEGGDDDGEDADDEEEDENEAADESKVQQIADHIDEDGSGTMSQAEFNAHVAQLQENGLLSEDEIAEMNSEVGALFESMGGEIPICNVKDYIRGMGLSDDDIDNFFDTINGEDDGEDADDEEEEEEEEVDEQKVRQMAKHIDSDDNKAMSRDEFDAHVADIEASGLMTEEQIAEMQYEVGALFEMMGGEEIPICKVKDYIRGFSNEDIDAFFDSLDDGSEEETTVLAQGIAKDATELIDADGNRVMDYDEFEAAVEAIVESGILDNDTLAALSADVEGLLEDAAENGDEGIAFCDVKSYIKENFERDAIKAFIEAMGEDEDEETVVQE